MHRHAAVLVALASLAGLAGCQPRHKAVRPTVVTEAGGRAPAQAEPRCAAPSPFLVEGACVACRTSADCAVGERCSQGACLAATSTEPGWKVHAQCTADAQCGEGGRCDAGVCQEVVAAACGLEPVTFPLDSSELEAPAQAALRRNAACLASQRARGVLVEGHCDERGGTKYNYDLGQHRAQVVKTYLDALGVKGVDTISFGKDYPREPRATSEEQHQRNRRAEFRLDRERRADGQVVQP